MSATLDARGLNCPLPILKTKKAIKEVPVGETLKVLSTDPGSVKDMDAFCRTTGNDLVESGQDGDTYTFLIRRKA
ncbi:MAG: sulfurtransferase TusA family protein [Myxococcales bacterium]|jgi:tRNA 2-thiouridine synthesizing protein A|nr:sulfurtransferase TusA family protein [Acidimicrobiia bacterium]MBM3951628.1 sulfurtransferase TusA family protein [Rhodospirillales bacterium]RJO72794.1 MAG: sulfurtransferase TusA family protein [Myxococcales bacterium]